MRVSTRRGNRMGLHPVTRRVALLVGLLLTAAQSSCGEDDVGPQSHMVGGRCVADSDCINRCVKGTEFPGGYCTVPCTTDNDCPGGSACAASNGGVCLATCQTTTDCKDYGTAYQCNRLSRAGGGTGVLVCAAN
jgi:hypothetical protein